MTELVEDDGSRGVVESLEELNIRENLVLKSNQIPDGDDAASEPVQKEEAPDRGTFENGVFDDLVDHALRDALSHNRHRHAVLHLEETVENFLTKSTEPQYMFPSEASTYERLLIHRTAQHWGMETSTINQGPEQGCILAVRTLKSGPPAIKLADFPVTLDESAAAAQGPAPRLLVRKRNDRSSRHAQGHPHGLPGAGGYQRSSGPQTMEDRELHYEQTRRRIFGDSGGGGMYVSQTPPAHMMPYPFGVAAPSSVPGPLQSMSAGGSTGAVGGGGPYKNPSTPRSGGGPQAQGGGCGGMQNNAAANGNVMLPTNNSAGQGRGKAQLRNRQEDLSDPDFRRNRHSGPRFDPGYGDDIVRGGGGGIYVHPTYSSEFPELAVGGGPGGAMPLPHQSSRVNNNSNNNTNGHGGAYQPMMAAPMTHYGYSQGMIPAGTMMAPTPMPGGGGPGGMPLFPPPPHHQGAPAMSYPGGAYLAPMGNIPYGYMPVRPDGSMMHGGMMQVHMAYGGYPSNAMAAGMHGHMGMMSTSPRDGGLPPGGASNAMSSMSPQANRRGAGPGGRRGGGAHNTYGSRGSNSSANTTPRAVPLDVSTPTTDASAKTAD